jgi:DNA-binding MarR family transcriptional regulator
LNNSAKPTGDTIKSFMRIVRLSQSILKESDSYLKKVAGLSFGKYVVLMVLYFNGGSLTSSLLAEKTGTTPHNITALIKTLKPMKLVSTEKRGSDYRFVYVSLTDKGRELMERILPAAEMFIATTMASFEGSDLDRLENLLNKIEKNVTDKSMVGNILKEKNISLNDNA